MRDALAARTLLILIIFAIAFGVEEAIIVLYLRQLPPNSHLTGTAAATVGLAQQIIHLETARELCTLIILGTVAWLATANPADRIRAFLVAFGAWDITYYVAMFALSGSPQITSQDVLFLIPIPWIGPVRAAMSFAFALILIGAFGIERRRTPALVAGLLLGWLSFVLEPFKALYLGHGGAVPQAQSMPYPVWLFVPAILLVAAALRWPTANATPAGE